MPVVGEKRKRQSLKIFTWNTQGETWNGVKDKLMKEMPDVAVIQEAGNLPGVFGVGQPPIGQPTKIGTQGDYSVYYVYWDRKAGAGNSRCSMAMLFQGEGGPSCTISTDDNKRPIMHKTIKGHYVMNIHAGGQEYVQQAIDLASSNHRWVVVGDFNQDLKVDKMQLKQKYKVAEPPKQTRKSGTILDYAVSNRDGGKATLLKDYGGSDHVPVVIEWD